MCNDDQSIKRLGTLVKCKLLTERQIDILEKSISRDLKKITTVSIELGQVVRNASYGKPMDSIQQEGFVDHYKAYKELPLGKNLSEKVQQLINARRELREIETEYEQEANNILNC